MGFFSWLFGKQEATPVPIANLPGPGTYSLDVVGESNYQAALKSICGGRSTRSQEKIVEAILIHEDDNPHDNQAIRISVQGKTVGYLSRKEARKYRKQLKEAGYPGITAKCSAMIVGGWDKGGGDRGHFGVRLDLPTEENSIEDKRGAPGPSPKEAPAMQEETTRVIFRKWPEGKVEGVRAGRIFALFPEVPAAPPAMSVRVMRTASIERWFMTCASARAGPLPLRSMQASRKNLKKSVIGWKW